MTLDLASIRITLHFTDNFMRSGIETILKELPDCLTLPRPVAIFDTGSYYAILPLIQRNTVCIMLCGEQPCLFLPPTPVLYRVSRFTTPVNLRDIIITLSDGRSLIHNSATPFHLDETEKLFIDLFIAGASPDKISRILGLHVKTIYIMRHRIISKFSCKTLPEFSLLCHSLMFRHWFMLLNSPVSPFSTNAG